LTCNQLTISALDTEEDQILFSGFTDSGRSLTQETLEKLFRVPGSMDGLAESDPAANNRLDRENETHHGAVVAQVHERHNQFFDEERERLDRWADDQIRSLETDLEMVKKRVMELRREERTAETLEQKTTTQSKIADLERQKRKLRMTIFDEEDAITERRDALIHKMESKLHQTTTTKHLFTIRWRIQ